jgi:hypothetical protein
MGRGVYWPQISTALLRLATRFLRIYEMKNVMPGAAAASSMKR